ncbi:cytochrome P450 [Nocardia uniformis]|uniref:Cytochrome P450 n=1 Tax=Nocardia uniformis TaxID=53432 RepID=A0A849CBW0_9NOCA|nr:cytochrome P450 [Nocardia uniformis]NNH73850.1 cytochrome P450 [Nocardia uniformis]
MIRTRRDAPEAIPHPRGRLPILGDVTTLNLGSPTQQAARDAARLGPIFERRVFTQPVVIVSGAELIAEINDDAAWCKKIAPIFLPLREVAAGLFTSDNDSPSWRLAHHVLAPGFTRPAMARYHDTMTAAVGELLDEWRAHPRRADIGADMNSLTLEIIGRSAFGMGFGSFTGADGPHPFVEAMLRGLTWVHRTINLPTAVQHTVFRRQLMQVEQDIALLHATVDDVIAARRREGNADPTDLLGLMLTSVDPETGERMSPEAIRAECLTMLVAGHETSAGAAAFAMWELSRRPEIVARIRAELAEHCGPAPLRLDFEQVARLRYLRRVVDETLRLYPVAPGYFRRPRQPTMLADRYPFTPDQWVLVLTLAAHRDPAAWGPDADRFDPDRWGPDRIRPLGEHVYKPFGTGARACLGRAFALHELVLTLAHIVSAFDLAPDPTYLRLRVSEQLTLKPRGLRIRLSPRA